MGDNTPRREQRHPRGRRRWRGGGLLRVLGEVLVICLLAGGFAADHWNLGARWFGLTGPDPSSQPGQVRPPAGLRLPSAAPAVAVAGEAPMGGRLDRAKIAAALASYLRDKKLGRQVGVYVGPMRPASPSEAITYHAGPSAITPASTTKLLTSLAALETLGPEHTFATTVVQGAAKRQITLVGGGDPFLSSKPSTDATSYPHRADLTTLARKTAARLKSQGIAAVRLEYDATLFSGPMLNPRWPSKYVPEEVVPISALWADEGVTSTGAGYAPDPAAAAASDFRDALRSAGIRVEATPAAAKAPAGASTISEVSSAPLSQIVERVLLVSDNKGAEVIAHQVGRAVAGQASFDGGVTAVTQTLTKLGVPMTGTRLYDGSGLTRGNLIAGTTLLGVLRAAASADRPRLRAVLTGLPVAGFSGSLAYRFGPSSGYAQGHVRAKTGTLSGVHALAGLATDRQGDQMVFVIDADRVGKANDYYAQGVVDKIAAALGNCSCRAP